MIQKVSPIKTNSITILKGILNSYSQIFFSKSIIFSVLLMLVSFFDYMAGLCGILSILISNLIAFGLGFDRNKIISGLYGFNALLVGLGIGIYYEYSWLLFLILALASVFTFFISVVLEGIIGKYGLPFLSIPFLLVFWAISLASREFHALGISERGIYTLNDLYIIGGQSLVDFYTWFNSIPIFESLKIYFISLGAIFFQYNVLSGLLISIGLLLFSRIAFTLSLIGFYGAYIFYHLIGAQITEVTYTYIGFNYILSAIAIGGYFLIPSLLSYLWTIILIPVVAIITISSSIIFGNFGLSIFSLPFNIIVLIFIYSLKIRTYKSGKLTEVPVQYNSPEKNLYLFKTNLLRFSESYLYMPIKLPFIGEWTVSQAHNGQYTHKGEWQHAWDFIITDENNKQFTNDGNVPDHYYAYKKSVVATADGIINEIIDNIPDNKIGDVNTEDNWGNTIIIKHTEFLYTKLCHLKAGSFKVSKGDFVKQGQVLALCGNSGRSPYPHLHFQLQATPFVGSKTLDYPLCNYISHNSGKNKLHSFDKPNIDDKLSNIQVNDLMKHAFNFIPGKKLKYVVINGDKKEFIEWEVITNVYNRSFIYCSKTQSSAYFISDGNILYFSHFEGDKNSILFYFMLAYYKLNLGFYQDVEMTDFLPITMLYSKSKLFFHDFIAPFYQIISSSFSIKYVFIDDYFQSNKIVLNSNIKSHFLNKSKTKISFESEIGKYGIEKIIVNKSNGENFIISMLHPDVEIL